MSSPEARDHTPRLEQYTESFTAPFNKRKDVAELLLECKKYEITSPIMPLVNLDAGYVEINVNTIQEGRWQVNIMEAPLPSFPYVNGNARQMQHLEERLAGRQGVSLPPKKHASMSTHARGMYLIAGNVEIFDDLLTNNRKKRSGRKVASRQPAWFIENDIPHPIKDKDIRTDLVLVGSDNRFRPLEFGNAPAKIGQVINQAAGLRRYYRQVTGEHLPPERVVPYVVRYNFTGEVNQLSIYPVEKLYAELSQNKWRGGVQETYAAD